MRAKLFEVAFKAEQWVTRYFLSETGDEPDSKMLDDMCGELDFDDLEVEQQYVREVDINLPLTKMFGSGKLKRGFFSVHDVLDAEGEDLACTEAAYRELLRKLAEDDRGELELQDRKPAPGQKEMFE